MSEAQNESKKGGTVNVGGSIIATAAKLTPSSPAVDTTNSAKDGTTVVRAGGLIMTITNAINLGYLRRSSDGTLEELDGPTTPPA